VRVLHIAALPKGADTVRARMAHYPHTCNTLCSWPLRKTGGHPYGKGCFLGYIRVSTVDQGTGGHPLDGQVSRLREKARAEGIELIEVVQDAESGAKQRDGLGKVSKRVLSGEVEGILFPKLGHLGRSQLHLASLVKEARDRGFGLLSSDEGWQVFRGELRNRALPFLIAPAHHTRAISDAPGFVDPPVVLFALGTPVQVGHSLPASCAGTFPL
jgi:hypothetical protein